jgi:sec-independent protein translocase protein TatC
MDDQEYTLIEHLRDLRTRLVRAVIGLTIAAFGCFFIGDQLLEIVRRPMMVLLPEGSQFVVLAPQEYFFTKMKMALVAGLFLASPWILYQFWLFVAPGLYRNERRYVFSFVFFGAFFFCAGAAFGYTVVFPPMFNFFLETLPPGVTGQYSVELVYGFAIHMLLAFGVVFEAPVVVFLLAILGVVEPRALAGYRRYVIVIAFIVAAILTPTPDPITQSLMAGPMILLYELGLLAARIFVPARPDEAPADPEESAGDAPEDPSDQPSA